MNCIPKCFPLSYFSFADSSLFSCCSYMKYTALKCHLWLCVLTNWQPESIRGSSLWGWRNALSYEPCGSTRRAGCLRFVPSTFTWPDPVQQWLAVGAGRASLGEAKNTTPCIRQLHCRGIPRIAILDLRRVFWHIEVHKLSDGFLSRKTKTTASLWDGQPVVLIFTQPAPSGRMTDVYLHCVIAATNSLCWWLLVKPQVL